MSVIKPSRNALQANKSAITPEERKFTPGMIDKAQDALANNDADFGYIRPKLRPTSANTPHLTHIKQKNVVKKFAFATRVGFEPGNPDKTN